MQSSFKVIKNSSVLKQGNKEITTEFNKDANGHSYSNNESKNGYETLAENILQNAKRQGEKILSMAFAESEGILQKSSSTGYKEGYDKGYFEGNQQGHESVVVPASEEAKEIITNAESILRCAKKEYENYIQEKEKEIKEFILIAVENILKERVESSEALNNMVLGAISNSKNVKLFIIRTNSLYFEEIKSQVTQWKTKLGYKEDIIVILDNLVEPGSAIIEKDNGKVVVGIDKGLERLREILQGKD